MSDRLKSDDESGKMPLGKATYNRRRALSTIGGIASLTLFPGISTLGSTSIEKIGALNVKFYDHVNKMKKDIHLKDGMLAITLGYYEIGDGGEGMYKIRNSDERLKLDEGSQIAIDNNKIAELTGVKSVNYKMFGAKSDSIHDDGKNIKRAHRFANKENIPIINLKGEYWINETKGIEILTNVEWGHTIFHIDEQYNAKSQYRFNIKSRYSHYSIELDATKKGKLLQSIKPGVQLIPELKEYKNSLVFISDKNDRIGFRHGYKGQSHAKEEFFYVEEGGRIIGDIAWEFKDYTNLLVYPCDSNYLVVNGGTFYLSGNNPGKQYDGYWKNGFSITRSRVTIRNQWVGLEKGNEDISLTPRTGFYALSRAFDINMENIRLIPWIQDREGKEKDVGAGTYGISCNRTLQTRFYNVTAEGGKGYWGVFGTNLNKRFFIDRCNLNRVDVHFHCWHLHIRDSYIGYRGITVTGGGNLIVENTTVWSGHYFISFRRDFGSTWDGDIYINNCRHIPASKRDTGILRFSTANFNYHYPIHFSRNIFVQNFTVDYERIPDSKDSYWLMTIPPFSQMKNGDSIHFPNNISFKDIKVRGRGQGVRLMHVENPQGYRLVGTGGFDGDILQQNCKILFENIPLEKISNSASSKDVHFLLNKHPDASYLDSYALYPTVNLKNCTGFTALITGAANLILNCCGVNFIEIGQKKPLQGMVDLYNCQLEPKVNRSRESFYILSAKSGISFTNCLFLSPEVDGVRKPELINNSGVIEINKAVRYNHLNSRVGNSVRDCYRKRGISMSKRFIQMLKSHNELETEMV